MSVGIKTEQFGLTSRKTSRWAKTGTSGKLPEVLFFKEGSLLGLKESCKKSFHSTALRLSEPGGEERRA